MNKIIYKIAIILVLISAFDKDVKAQVSITDSAITLSHIDVNYTFNLPGGDLISRFGYFHGIGGGFFVKDKNNFEYGVDGAFLFGNQLKNLSMIDNLLTEAGTIINQDGEFADILASMRGVQARATIGKVITWNVPNPNSGILIRLGVGFWQHKYRIEDKNTNTPQLAWPYQKGYDRLTNGLMLSQMVAYQFFSNSRLLNFYVGVEVNEGFTKNRRPYNFSEKRRDDTARLDVATSFKVGWMIPIYKRAPQEFYYR